MYSNIRLFSYGIIDKSMSFGIIEMKVQILGLLLINCMMYDANLSKPQFLPLLNGDKITVHVGFCFV